jgi:hypothetical protein
VGVDADCIDLFIFGQTTEAARDEFLREGIRGITGFDCDRILNRPRPSALPAQ